MFSLTAASKFPWFFPCFPLISQHLLKSLICSLKLQEFHNILPKSLWLLVLYSPTVPILLHKLHRLCSQYQHCTRCGIQTSPFSCWEPFEIWTAGETYCPCFKETLKPGMICTNFGILRGDAETRETKYTWQVYMKWRDWTSWDSNPVLSAF